CGRAAARASGEVVLDRLRSSLAEESQLRGYALREAVRRLAHHVRRSTEVFDPAVVAGRQAEVKLREVVEGNANTTAEIDRSVLVEARLIQVQPATPLLFRTLATYRKGHQTTPNPAVEDIHKQLRENLRPSAFSSSSREWLSHLQRVAEPGSDPSLQRYSYHLAIACPLRSAVGGLPHADR